MGKENEKIGFIIYWAAMLSCCWGHLCVLYVVCSVYFLSTIVSLTNNNNKKNDDDACEPINKINARPPVNRIVNDK